MHSSNGRMKILPSPLSFVTGATGFQDGVDGRVDELVVDGDLRFDLTQEVNGILMTTVLLCDLFGAGGRRWCQSNNFDGAQTSFTASSLAG